MQKMISFPIVPWNIWLSSTEESFCLRKLLVSTSSLKKCKVETGFFCSKLIAGHDFTTKIWFLGYKADVICLQELDHREHEHFFQYRFSKLGYESVFHRKGDCSSEGMGCIYNAKKFE